MLISSTTASCWKLSNGESIYYSRRLEWNYRKTWEPLRMDGKLSTLSSHFTLLNFLNPLVKLGLLKLLWLPFPTWPIKLTSLSYLSSWPCSSCKQSRKTLVISVSVDSSIALSTKPSDQPFLNSPTNWRASILVWLTLYLHLTLSSKHHSELLMVISTTDTLDWCTQLKIHSRESTGGRKSTRLTRNITLVKSKRIESEIPHPIPFPSNLT